VAPLEGRCRAVVVAGRRLSPESAVAESERGFSGQSIGLQGALQATGFGSGGSGKLTFQDLTLLLQNLLEFLDAYPETVRGVLIHAGNQIKGSTRRSLPCPGGGWTPPEPWEVGEGA